jgi:PAS domain S-box-containing protein
MSTPAWRRLIARGHLWLLAALVGATALLYLSGVLSRIDMAIYDAALPGGPAPADVLIVAIDDHSLATLGRWPWPRSLHAALLDRLRAAGVRSVALDLLLSEPGAPADDAALAAAMARGPPTVLPSFAEFGPGAPREQLPIAILARAAAGIGHAQLEIDPDGIVRSVFLREGPGKATRLYLAAALLANTPGIGPLQLPGARHPDVPPAADAWVRDYRILIPFLGPPGHFRQVSYVDVLDGKVPPAALRGRIVLIGATAQGLGDALPTPMSGHARAMPGVEVTANVLQALRSGSAIRPVGMPLTILIGSLPVLLIGFGLQRLGPRQSLLLAFVLGVATLAGAVLALRGGWWWPPSAALAAVLAAYPLWSWRRLEAMQAFFEEQFVQLAQERFPLLQPPLAAGGSPRSNDFVQRRIDLLRHATDGLRSTRRLFAATVNSLPDATVLADERGRIVLANPAAAALFKFSDCAALEGRQVDALLEGAGVRSPGFATLAQRAPGTEEFTLTDSGRTLLARTAPFHDGSQRRVGTIIDLADITELRAVQREREDIVRFLSHDMKSPATSLLGLAQLQRDPARALPPPELSQRLDLLAQRMLTLLDSFVALARAESADPTAFDTFDLRDALQDAYDEVWAAAQARGVTIAPNLPGDACTVSGDRQLLARAIVNLLGNAVKFSPAGGTVALACARSDHICVVSVADYGPGIAPERQAGLFQRFSRGLHSGHHDPGGAGLGLAFVRVVAEKHGGKVWTEPNIHSGSVFQLSLPAESSEDQGR